MAPTGFAALGCVELGIRQFEHGLATLTGTTGSALKSAGAATSRSDAHRVTRTQRDCVTSAAKTIAAIVNPKAGGVAALGAEKVVALLRDALPAGADILQIDDPGDAFERVLAARPEALVVAGGDGTQAATAARMAEAEIPFAPLPGGTLNILPKRAFGARTLEDAIASLREAKPRRISAARADGKLFLVAACVGPIVRLAELREAPRKGTGLKRIWRSVRYLGARTFNRHFSYRTLERGWSNAHALMVSVGDVDSAFGRPAGAPLVNNGPLEAAAVTFRGWVDVGRFSIDALTGGWRSFPGAAVWETSRTELDGRGRALPALLDGEAASLSAHCAIVHDPKGVLIWAPPPEAA